MKTKNTEKVLVIDNLRNRTVTYTLPAAVANTTWTDALNSGTVTLTNQITLQPYEYLVMKNQ
jgi:hypothetical protein